MFYKMAQKFFQNSKISNNLGISSEFSQNYISDVASLNMPTILRDRLVGIFEVATPDTSY